MKPMFVLCPHCTFPVVVHPVEIGSLRRCRQCRGEFVPGTSGKLDSPSAKRNYGNAARSALRAAVQQHRRSMH